MGLSQEKERSDFFRRKYLEEEGPWPCAYLAKLYCISHPTWWTSPFGQADAVTLFSPCAALADAAATAIGNRVRLAEDIPEAIEFAKRVPGLSGVAIVKDDVLGLWGKIQLTSMH